MALTTPEVIAQRAQPDAARNEICGECALAAALTARGIPTRPQQIIDFIESVEGGEVGVANGTFPWVLGLYLDHIGVHWYWKDVSAPGAYLPELRAACAADYYSIWMGCDDGNGQPAANGRFRHWILCWSTRVDAMNTWDGGLHVYNPAVMEAAAEYILVIKLPQPLQPVNPSPVQPHSGGVISRRPNGTYDMVVRGTDNAIWHCWASSVAGLTTEHPWENLGGQTHQAPWCASEANSTDVWVWCVGTDTKLYRKGWVNGKWGQWGSVAGNSPA